MIVAPCEFNSSRHSNLFLEYLNYVLVCKDILVSCLEIHFESNGYKIITLSTVPLGYRLKKGTKNNYQTINLFPKYSKFVHGNPFVNKTPSFSKKSIFKILILRFTISSKKQIVFDA